MNVLYPFSKGKILPNGGQVTILGSTGTIGVRTLEILEGLKGKSRHFEIQTLVAGQNLEILARQVKACSPRYVALKHKEDYYAFKEMVGAFDGKILCGREGILEASSVRSDYVMSAIVGTAGLEPTLSACHKDTIIALANKECIVTGGQVFLDAVREKGAYIFPIDSEHSALYHLTAHKDFQIDKYYITASGGPFRNYPLNKFDKITVEMACRHPNWNMGAKISVDSATMMNKGLELIEACYLLGLTDDKCEAVLHPQSLVHGMVRNASGEILFIASEPDMGIPIFSSLCYAHEEKMERYFDPMKAFSMEFLPIEKERYPLFFLAKKALKEGGIVPALLNAVNEIAVESFLNKKINFNLLPCFIEETMNNLKVKLYGESKKTHSISQILALDEEVRLTALEVLDKIPLKSFAL